MKSFRITDREKVTVVVGENEKDVTELYLHEVESNKDNLHVEEISKEVAFFWKREMGYSYSSVSERIKDFKQFPCIVGSNFQ
ncbi:hypothetical protein [Bacillus sp. FSL R7-0642]|uniref:hypothetical protein n=1 Tax=Bacillus sp. FSL R7-0642 TaxID=2921585 RepID=UPI0030FBA33B